MIVLGVQDRLADATEELGEHGAGAGLGGALALAPALADGDEALLELGDLSEDLGHLLVAAGVASVAEPVKVAFGRAGAGAAAAPVGVFSHGGRRIVRVRPRLDFVDDRDKMLL